MRTIATIIMVGIVLASNVMAKDSFPIQKGKASWYSVKCNHGTKTKSGKRLSDTAFTVAHKTLPMGTKVKVTNLKNGKSVICTVSDHGPNISNRILDVTIGVARELDFVKRGITEVTIEVIGKLKK